jgi:hypothetical protein
VRVAFKEWAVVVDALGQGRQTLLLRKGGIAEGRAGFQVEHTEFLLFPTRFHQQRAGVIPPARERFDQLRPQLPPEGEVRLEYCAHVAWWRPVRDERALAALADEHIWQPEVIAERFRWGRTEGVLALVLRVARLPVPVTLPQRPAYGGCRSWVELETDVETTAAVPVLADSAWAKRARRLEEVLG